MSTANPEFVEIITHAFAADSGAGVRPILNVYHFKRASLVPTLNKAGIHTAFQAAIGAPLLLALSVAYEQDHTSIRFLEDVTDAATDFADAGVGAIAGQNMPDYVTVSVQLKSGLRGRAARGAKRFAPIGESQSDGDVLAAASVTLFQNLAAAILAGFTDAQTNVWTPVVVSRLPPSQLETNPTTIVTYNVIETEVNEGLGIMRRRKARIAA